MLWLLASVSVSAALDWAAAGWDTAGWAVAAGTEPRLAKTVASAATMVGRCGSGGDGGGDGGDGDGGGDGGGGDGGGDGGGGGGDAGDDDGARGRPACAGCFGWFM